MLVHNANCKLIGNGDGTYDVELSYKEDWTPEQRFEADVKVRTLSEADTIKTKPERFGSASNRYKTEYGKDSVNSVIQDIDHTVDLQLGGADDVMNMTPLDRSVNRSLGRQINYVIKDLEVGAVLKNFFFKSEN